MTVTPKKMYADVPPTENSAVAYTVPSQKKAIVKNIVICNTSDSPATVNIWVSGFAVVSVYTVAARDTVVIDSSIVMDEGDTITIRQGTADAIAVHISGVEVV